MPIRVLIFGKQGDGSASAAMAQVRALIMEMRLDASAQMVTDPAQLAMNGVDGSVGVSVDGLMIANGWVPSRNEIIRAFQQRVAAINVHKTPGAPG
jgi:hypothetical protein